MVKFLIKAGFLLVILVAASAGDPDKGGSLFSRAFFGTPADYRQAHQTPNPNDPALNGLAGASAGQSPAVSTSVPTVSPPRGLTEGPDRSFPDPQGAIVQATRSNPICAAHLAGGTMPNVTAARDQRAQILCNAAYVVQTNPSNRTPLWTAHRLTPASVQAARGTVRSSEFFEDSRVSSQFRATLTDYRRSGFDRGHMVPSGDMPGDQHQQETFSLTNIVPQDPVNNRCFWSDIEMALRNYVFRTGQTIYVITMPLNRTLPPRTIGAGVVVPSHLLKAAYEPATGKSIVFMAENVAEPDWTFGTIDHLKRANGLELFPAAANAEGIIDIDPRQSRARSGCPQTRQPRSS